MNESANCKTKIMQLLRIFKEEAKFLRAGKLIDVTDLSSSKMTAVSDVEMAFNAVPNVEIASRVFNFSIAKLGLMISQAKNTIWPLITLIQIK